MQELQQDADVGDDNDNQQIPNLGAVPINPQQEPSQPVGARANSSPQQSDSSQIDRIDRSELPPFWNRRVKLWFTAVEAQFQYRKVKADTTKYLAIIARLDQDALSVIEHIITAPPINDKYLRIKEALTNHYSVSQERQFKTLVSGLELGDRRPSELLAEMHRLGGNLLDDTFTRTLWLDRLPEHVQVALAAADGLNSDALSQLADKILDIQRHPTGGRLMPISQEKPHNNLEKCNRSRTGRSQQRSLTHRPQASDPAGGSSDTSTPSWCYYHRRFGIQASKCTTPCTWKRDQGNASSRP